MDTLLFSLLVLRSLADSQGRVWRCHPSHLCCVEVTLPDLSKRTVVNVEQCTLSLLALLPSVECVSPRKCYELARSKSKGKRNTDSDHKISHCSFPSDPNKILMDMHEFRSKSYQLVYQYLKQHNSHHNLDSFKYLHTVEGDPADCLDVILQ